MGPANDPATRALLTALYTRFIPNKVVALLNPTHTNADVTARVPLLSGKSLVDGKPAAYVCKNYTCQLPVTTPEEFAKALGAN